MPLVSATNDDDFILEVTNVTAQADERQRCHTAAMIEEYLRRRAQAVEEAAHEAAQKEVEKLRCERADMEAAHASVLATLAKATDRLGEAAAALGRAHDHEDRQRAFGVWRVFVERRRGQRQQANVLRNNFDIRLCYHALVQWRLFASARSARKRENEKDAAAAQVHGKLARAIEELQEHLGEEAKRNAHLEKELRDAFVKGVTALNREAVQVLRGGEGARDAQEIEDILSGSRQSTAVSPTSQTAQKAIDAGVPEGVCPVHHRDATGVYYHPCYAPCSCPHYPGAGAETNAAPRDSSAHRSGCPHHSQPMHSLNAGSAAVKGNTSVDSSQSSQHTPFVVRADLSAARSFDTDYPRRPGQRPRWH